MTTLLPTTPAPTASAAAPDALRLRCQCCGSERHQPFSVREMQYGSREPFGYQECLDCGSLQIAQVPADLARHYHHDKYASWRALPAYLDKPIGGVSRWLRAQRARHLIHGDTALGAWLCKVLGAPEMPDPGTWAWLRLAGAGPATRIFDFGCGTGELLRYLRLAGFSDLVGHDKFSGCSLQLPGLQLSDRMPGPDERFDLVMAHHSVEHLPEPEPVLRALARLVAPGGTLLLRVPVAQTHAWRTYGADWIQLDAPRHLFIPSRAGMEQLAARCGLRVRQVLFDSSNFQFLGSEQYRQDIPMFGDPRSYFDGAQDRFTRAQAAGWAQQARALNAADDGDQACFFLQVDTA
jgi:SAM-dependent methyltransferase